MPLRLSQLGQSRHFERAPAMSAFPPIATELLRYGNRRDDSIRRNAE